MVLFFQNVSTLQADSKYVLSKTVLVTNGKLKKNALGKK
jgi:hypothetical protein